MAEASAGLAPHRLAQRVVSRVRGPHGDPRLCSRARASPCRCWWPHGGDYVRGGRSVAVSPPAGRRRDGGAGRGGCAHLGPGTHRGTPADAIRQNHGRATYLRSFPLSAGARVRSYFSPLPWGEGEGEGSVI